MHRFLFLIAALTVSLLSQTSYAWLSQNSSAPPQTAEVEDLLHNSPDLARINRLILSGEIHKLATKEKLKLLDKSLTTIGGMQKELRNASVIRVDKHKSPYYRIGFGVAGLFYTYRTYSFFRPVIKEWPTATARVPTTEIPSAALEIARYLTKPFEKINNLYVTEMTGKQVLDAAFKVPEEIAGKIYHAGEVNLKSPVLAAAVMTGITLYYIGFTSWLYSEALETHDTVEVNQHQKEVIENTLEQLEVNLLMLKSMFESDLQTNNAQPTG